MRGEMVHRGPDSAGEVVLDGAVLGMRRLAIIDVHSGHQPLVSENGRIHIICNGEIYNFKELRADLEHVGHTFRTSSDCEVIVHAYEQYGDDFVTRLNGMFALAVWDDARQRLLLARDRIGIKPLVYAEYAGLLLFASEAKALLAYPGFPRQLDPVAVDQYLAYQYIPTPRSIYADMRKLRPGHVLLVERGRIREYAYGHVDLTADRRVGRQSEAGLAEELWQTLRESVRLELVSDVPLGVFLSGGIDSSALVAAMADLSTPNIRTFSISFTDSSFDESRHARQVARAFGTHHSEMMLEPPMIWDLIPRVAEFLDEPLADASIVPTYLLSSFTRRYVTVALGGDGGDELFAGYSTLQAHRLAGYYACIPSVVRRQAIAPLVGRLPVSHNNLSLDFRAKRFIQNAELPLAARHQRWLGPCSPIERRELLEMDVLRRITEHAENVDPMDEHLGRVGALDELSQVLYLDMKMYLESDILPKVDRASMACSLEVRVPLLNRLMLDFATRLPIDLKLHGLTRKYLLRKALAGRLPQEIIDRPKKGFGLPVSKWLTGELRDLMLDTLSEDRLRRQGVFRPAQVTRLIDEHLRRRRDNRMVLWAMLVFQFWYDKYMGSAPVAHPMEAVVNSA